MGSQVDLEAFSISLVRFRCQIPMHGSHHRPIEESEQRHDDAQDTVDAAIQNPKRDEDKFVGIQQCW